MPSAVQTGNDLTIRITEPSYVRDLRDELRPAGVHFDALTDPQTVRVTRESGQIENWNAYGLTRDGCLVVSKPSPDPLCKIVPVEIVRQLNPDLELKLETMPDRLKKEWLCRVASWKLENKLVETICARLVDKLKDENILTLPVEGGRIRSDVLFVIQQYADSSHFPHLGIIDGHDLNEYCRTMETIKFEETKEALFLGICAEVQNAFENIQSSKLRPGNKLFHEVMSTLVRRAETEKLLGNLPSAISVVRNPESVTRSFLEDAHPGIGKHLDQIPDWKLHRIMAACRARASDFDLMHCRFAFMIDDVATFFKKSLTGIASFLSNLR